MERFWLVLKKVTIALMITLAAILAFAIGGALIIYACTEVRRDMQVCVVFMGLWLMSVGLAYYEAMVSFLFPRPQEHHIQ